jgi:hypothetical protein
MSVIASSDQSTVTATCMQQHRKVYTTVSVLCVHASMLLCTAVAIVSVTIARAIVCHLQERVYQ